MLLPGEDQVVYESFRDGMYRRLDPRDELERMLADRVVLAAWKLRRAQAVEAARYAELRKGKSQWARVDSKLVAVPAPHEEALLCAQQSFERFAKYEAALERSMYRAIAELRKAQAQRGEDYVEDVAENEHVAGKNEPILEPTEPAAEASALAPPAPASDAVRKNEPISALTPSPGTPLFDPEAQTRRGEGGGEGGFARQERRERQKSPSS